MRKRKQQAIANTYRSDPNSSVCALCEHAFNAIIAQTDHFLILDNIAPYDWWDRQHVDTHYLLIPKTHVMHFHEFSGDALSEYMELITLYEKSGFSIYSRAQQNTIRSEAHLHTHLIKTGQRADRFLLLLKKPYLLFFR